MYFYFRKLENECLFVEYATKYFLIIVENVYKTKYFRLTYAYICDIIVSTEENVGYSLLAR